MGARVGFAFERGCLDADFRQVRADLIMDVAGDAGTFPLEITMAFQCLPCGYGISGAG